MDEQFNGQVAQHHAAYQGAELQQRLQEINAEHRRRIEDLDQRKRDLDQKKRDLDEKKRGVYRH
jgi:hypothetical protein